MRHTLLTILTICAILGAVSADAKTASVKVVSIGSATITPGLQKGSTAWSSWKNTVQENGWGMLNIKSFNDDNAEFQAYGAGYLESYFTSELMYDYWHNYVAAEYGPNGPPESLVQFMTSQLQWMREMIKKNPSDEYWKYMNLLLFQFDGLVDGYRAYANSSQPMSEIDIYMLNSVGDLEDLNGLFKYEYGLHERADNVTPLVLQTDCSGFIKITDDDLYCGQATWRSYYAMLRVYKIYDFGFNPQTPISFSSSPGFLHSKDDFYALGNGLIVMETTNNIFNKSLYQRVTNESALSWQRVMAACTLTNNGKDWTALFAKYNSGTYNNQWMVVDFKVFGKSNPKSDLLWIAEQIPGYVHIDDVSSVLTGQSYWPSYNIPYFVDVYDQSGYPDAKRQHGDEFDYDNCSRAKIFRRNETDVVEIEGFKNMMRYNGYPSDPLTPSPEKAVASRYDMRADSPAAFGAIDAKVTSYKMWSSDDGEGDTEKYSVWAVSGPTTDQQSPFDFSQFPDVVRDGVPQHWDFKWTQISPDPDL